MARKHPSRIKTTLLVISCGLMGYTGTAIVIAILEYGGTTHSPGIEMRGVYYGWDLIGAMIDGIVGACLPVAYVCRKRIRAKRNN